MKINKVNQHMWKLTPLQREKEYRKYCAWFEDMKKTQEGLQSLVDGKNFHEHNRVQKKGGLWDAKEFFPDSWGLFCVNTCDPNLLIAAATKNKLRNQRVIGEALKHVGGNPSAPLLDETYLQRARETKALRQKLKDYAGSDEAASDELFRMKKLADEQKKDFGVFAKEVREAMQGKNVEHPETPARAVPEPETPKRLWKGIRYFIHKLSGGYLCKEVGDL